MIVNPLNHPVCLSSPNRLTAVTAWEQHIPFAMFLVSALKPRLIVELGTHAGNSYCAFCQAVKELDLEARCFAIDTWQGDEHSGYYGPEVLEDLRAHHDPLYGSFSRLIQSSFDDALEHFAPQTIDILHIDGYHKYEAVKHDFESWLPKLSQDGIILFHDTNVRERGFGTRQLWEEVAARYEHFEFLHGHGLGVLAVDEVRSKELKALFSATPEETSAIRRCFFELGYALTLRRKLEANERLLSSVTLAATELNERLKRQAEELVRERAEQNKLATEVNSLTLQLAQKDESLLSLSVRIAQAEQEVLRLQSKMVEERQALEHRIELERQQLQRRIEVQREQFENQISMGDAQLALKESQLQERTNQLEQTRQRLQRVTSTLGWRLLSVYGRIKHRFLLPAYRAVRYLPEVLVRREYRPRIIPLNDLRPTDHVDEWEATGRDPQFDVPGPWPKGSIKVSIEVVAEPTVADDVRLYFDRGEGYSEDQCYSLGKANHKQERYIQFGGQIKGLRLDPLESAARFRLKTFVLKRVTGVEARLNNGHQPRRSGLPGFVDFAIERAHSFRRKNGRWPGVIDLPAAVSRTLRAWEQSSARSKTQNSEESPRPFQMPRVSEPYEGWLEVNEWNSRRDQLLRERLAMVSTQPLISVVMAVHNPALELLNRAIQSVAGQVYGNWELCIACEAACDQTVKDFIERLADRETRIRAFFAETNGDKSGLINRAAELSHGDYVVLIDQNDEITKDGLGEVAIHATENPNTDILYSDDDKIDPQGRRFDPQFKPDWSPELLLSCMYFSRMFVLKRELFWRLGGMREAFDASQEYDLALRATELTQHVGHIPRILYHVRAMPASRESSPKSNEADGGLRALQDALDRRSIRAAAVQLDLPHEGSSAIYSAKFAHDGLRVAIVIPTKNNVASLRKCLESLRKTLYTNYEVVIVDNASDEPDTLAYLDKIPHKVLRLPHSEPQFGLAAICNRAVAQVIADYVVFLNDNTEAVKPEWLSQMIGLLALPGAGAVGARLISPNQHIQHAGIVHGYNDGMAGAAFKTLPATDSGYLNYPIVTRNYSAVSADCLATRRSLFLEIGGFDEQNFPAQFTDIDYCQRLRSAGHRVVFCPDAEFICNQAISTKPEDNPRERAAFRRKYGRIRDTYYNPNLSLEHERFAIDGGTVASENVRPIRVLMCAFNLNLEGAPHSQFELTRGLKRAGVIEPLVYCPQDGPLRRLYEEEGAQVEVFEHPLAGVHTPEAYERAIQQFTERIRGWNVELVYGNTRQTFYAIDAARRNGLPSIWNPRESEPWQTYFDYLGPEVGPQALGCFAYPYKVIFVADASREDCSALNTRHNFMTIHNGLDQGIFTSAVRNWPRPRARSELGLGDDDIMLLLPGTVCERKGQIDLIEAAGLIGEQQRDKVRLFIVGDRAGEYSEGLRAALNRLPDGLRARISLVPETPDIARYFTAADIFVCTSRIESFPRVILEAMACGLPIVTTPVYGIREQVQENVNALFYEPGEPSELADRITTLLSDPSLRQRLASNSKPVLETLPDFDTMISSYARVFREAWLSGRTR